MPVAAGRICSQPGCPHLQPCRTHPRAKSWHRNTPKRQVGGTGWKWQRIRTAILERDGYLCRIALPGCTGRATVVDHIVGVAQGGSDNPHNLRGACHHCNEQRRREQARGH